MKQPIESHPVPDAMVHSDQISIRTSRYSRQAPVKFEKDRMKLSLVRSRLGEDLSHGPRQITHMGPDTDIHQR